MVELHYIDHFEFVSWLRVTVVKRLEETDLIQILPYNN